MLTFCITTCQISLKFGQHYPYYQYLTLVKMSSQKHFPILRHKNLGPTKAKRAIFGQSVKYAILAGRKNLNHSPKNICQVEFPHKISSRLDIKYLISYQKFSFSPPPDVQRDKEKCIILAKVLEQGLQ